MQVGKLVSFEVSYGFIAVRKPLPHNFLKC